MTTTKRESVDPSDMVHGEVIIVTDEAGTEVLRGEFLQNSIYAGPRFVSAHGFEITAHNGHYEREVKVPTVGERFRAAPVGTTFTLDGEVRVRLSGGYYASFPMNGNREAYPGIYTLHSNSPPLWDGEPEGKAAWSVPTKA